MSVYFEDDDDMEELYVYDSEELAALLNHTQNHEVFSVSPGVTCIIISNWTKDNARLGFTWEVWSTTQHGSPVACDSRINPDYAVMANDCYNAGAKAGGLDYLVK